MNSLRCSNLLFTWLNNESSPENVKSIAKSIGYNDNPFFGAKKKKAKLMGELVILNTALVIIAVNQVVEENEAKLIIDSFLSKANKSIFNVLEKHYPNFRKSYEANMSEYFTIIQQENPGLGVSFTFLTSLGIDPLKSLNAQLFISTKFGNSLTKTIEALKSMSRM